MLTSAQSSANECLLWVETRRSRITCDLLVLLGVAGSREFRPPVWFAFDDSRPLAFFAGVWTRWTSVRKVREGETTNDLFGFLTTEPNAIVGAVHALGVASTVRTTTPAACTAFRAATARVGLARVEPERASRRPSASPSSVRGLRLPLRISRLRFPFRPLVVFEA